MFNKVYCINLANRTDRWNHFMEEQKYLPFECERFEAINGKECGILPNPPPNPTWSTIGLGTLGDILSHREIILSAIKQKLNNVLILEDDVEFNKSIDLNEYLACTPNKWDMLYFGGAHRNPLIPINDKWGKCTFTLTTHAVALNKTIFTKVLDITSGLGAPVDLYYAMLQPYYNVYSTLIPVAWQIDGYSDIDEKYVEYGHLK